MPFQVGDKAGLGRRVLADIGEYPEAEDIYNQIMAYTGSYRSHRADFFVKRDRALAAILYVCQLRKSEAMRLTKSQFKTEPFRVVAVKLSKAERFDKATGKTIVRKDQYRKEILIPMKGKLGKFGQLIEEYLKVLQDYELLFPFSSKAGRVNQILKEMLGTPPHWLRAYGENMLYEKFDYDLLATANYMQVNPGTLAKYIHRTPRRYLKKLTEGT